MVSISESIYVSENIDRSRKVFDMNTSTMFSTTADILYSEVSVRINVEELHSE